MNAKRALVSAAHLMNYL